MSITNTVFEYVANLNKKGDSLRLPIVSRLQSS